MSISRRDFVRGIGLSGFGLSTVGRPLTAADRRKVSADQSTNRLYDAGFINLSSNTSPRGPSEAVLNVLNERITKGLGRYPENVGVLVEAIAAREEAKVNSVFHCCLSDQVLLSTGSGEVLVGAVHAFVTPSRPLVIGHPSYETPIRTSEALDLPVKTIAVSNTWQLDLDEMAVAAEGAGLVYLCNPNNPTGVGHSQRAIREFVERVVEASPDTAILIDEAYIEFAKDPAIATALPLALANPNVIITRTFSKIHAMAGLRIGYAIGHADTLERMRTVARFGSVTVLSAAAALVSLSDSDRIEWEISENHKVREFTLSAFREMGCHVTDSQTNFVWVDVNRSPEAFREACFSLDVLVGRDFPSPSNTYSRISLGTMEEMRQAVTVFEKVLHSTA
ncbi:MAG TPA: histidinol-phosphate aminotransferase family protein [Acidobacteria bacterium]|nr:histidinol-phosphate aminotransferase family protein [Nitrospirales bacterium]HIA49194.1 histidinol-phosphate aminotransferase family protein [Acidobacteriota bacterium]HIN70570.1 histidinol-phosphate aminotransferase family protein [Acidobacteriota bacterium]HIO55008.1 histidinol-phosphate aminotransferase family protein [Chromatiales bacterium]